MPANIFIARHGQNEDNANSILNGHRDLPLTDLGRQQAQELAEGILELDIQFDAVYSSPLSRALETAQIASATLGIEKQPHILDDLIERDFGDMTGKPISQVVELSKPDILITETIPYFLKPKNGETFPQTMKRAERALQQIRKQQTEGNVLIVCHGDIGKMIYAFATGKNWKDVLSHFHFGNGDLIEITRADKVHVVKLLQHNL